VKKILAIIIILAAVGGCSNWVGLTVEGEGVRLATAAEISNCSRLGRTRSQTLDRIGGVERGAERLQEELLRLARNDAGAMGATSSYRNLLSKKGNKSSGFIPVLSRFLS
jgi:hypothetical protein